MSFRTRFGIFCEWMLPKIQHDKKNYLSIYTFEISPISRTTTIYLLVAKQSKNQCAKAKFSQKSQQTVNQQFREKMRKSKLIRRSIASETQHQRGGAILAESIFCTNLLKTQFLCDFCINFCIYKIFILLCLYEYILCLSYLTILLFYFTLDVITVSFLRYFNNDQEK